MADAINRVMTGASLAERRASLEQNRDALQRRLAELESEAAGQAALSSQPRRGTIQRGAVGVAREQAGVTRTGLIAVIRQQLDEVQREIATLEAEARTAEERARQILNPDSRAGGGNEAALRRQRAAEDIARLHENLDARLRIEREFQTRLTRIREAEAVGAIDAAEGQRLAAAATRERDEALQRHTTSQRGTTASTRERRDAERELNEVPRERERLIQQNETTYERYQRRIETLGRLVERSERVGRPLPDETIRREATAALKDLERAERRVAEGAERARNVGRELGLTFSSAFEDAIIRGKRFSEVLQGIGQDIARIIARRTITEPPGNAVSSALSGFSFDGIGSWLGGLFRAEGAPVAAGQPYVAGERGPEWFVPRQSGTVLSNGTAPGGTTINTSIAIDARGADAGIEARLRLLAGQIARQSSAMTLDAIRRGGAAYDTVNRYYGGHFAHATGVNASQDRFGVRFGNEAGAYSNHSVKLRIVRSCGLYGFPPNPPRMRETAQGCPLRRDRSEGAALAQRCALRIMPPFRIIASRPAIIPRSARSVTSAACFCSAATTAASLDVCTTTMPRSVVS